MSEREPELGLGLVSQVEGGRIAVDFPATAEKRLYALGTPVLKRVQFRPGETVTTRDGHTFQIESVQEEAGILMYSGGGQTVREDLISDITSVSLPDERLLAGQIDPGEVYHLRVRALEARWRLRQSDVRGFLGGRIQLIPHQFYILHEVSSRQFPRILLADEVGLGKTIEACLIMQRLLAVGRARRVLILVPEPLVHQWFVELLRRFNLWFSIYDEERCRALEQSEPGQNPFLSSQLALGSIRFLAEARREQVVAAGWDLVVVDEAHHLEWAPDSVSPEYALVEELARQSPGLLLLTATPMQLGMPGHFARLRLLDPDRYSDYPRFLQESEKFSAVAAIAEKIVDQKPLGARDRTALMRIFDRDPERLEDHLNRLEAREPRAAEDLLRTLLDQHGTGRVMFRNTRAAMTGFPRRRYRPVAVQEESAAVRARMARELQADEGGEEDALRYSYKGDARIAWLADFLRTQRSEKVLLICRSPRKVLAIDAALQERIKVKTGLFHEELPLVQRDRNAAWFAEPDGAQVLLCSEIGSEGRNFQFAHHLVLFDLPLNPGLLEQRIGRLDRIGQTADIQIHVPYIAGSSEEVVAEWYHRGLDAFETPVPGGNEYVDVFKSRLLELALAADRMPARSLRTQLDALIEDTLKFRRELSRKLKQGRDRLLELNSFDRGVADEVLARIRKMDADPFLRSLLQALLDHFGVRIKEHEEGDVFLDPAHAYLEAFPSIPREGMLATFDRSRAIAREDIQFLSADHALVRDAIDLLVDSPAGTSAFGLLATGPRNLVLEAVYVLETVADSRWHIDQFLAPRPVRVVVDLAGNDLTDDWGSAGLAAAVIDAGIQQFLDTPGFDAAVLKTMLETATEQAARRATSLTQAAKEDASRALSAEVQRLVDLQKINDHVRTEEIERARDRGRHVVEAIAQSRLRLDSLRLVVQGEG